MPTDSELDDLVDLTDTGQYVNAGDKIPQGWFDDAHDRYRAGSTMLDSSPTYWCVGDNQDGGNEGLVTSYIFREPDDTPWNPWNNPTQAT